MSDDALIVAAGLTKRFGAGPPAIDQLDARIEPARVTGLVGPDGSGKTTLLRLFAGLLEPTEGELTVCGADPSRELSKLREHVSYMPQRFGLYEDLTVQQNLTLYAALNNVVGAERDEAFERLLAFTDLKRFTDRLAGNLSGGMKQKLGLACALIRTPRLLLLDEPSVGVDPISRRELWKMVYELVDAGIGVVWSTSYLDEAERCSSVLLLSEGQLLYSGAPRELTRRMEGRSFLARSSRLGGRQLLIRALQNADVLDGVIQGSSVRLVMKAGAPAPQGSTLTGDANVEIRPVAPRFEDAFVDLLGGVPKSTSALSSPLQQPGEDEHAESGADQTVVQAEGLTKQFGDFTATDDISFEIGRGEIFGLLGPNGAGKSTTFKMMCGLLKPTSGRAFVDGLDLYEAAGVARARIGYMAQKFSLYGDLSVRQNLSFFAGVYGLRGEQLDDAVARVVGTFKLEPYLDVNSGELPLGFKQRLALACAIMHEPAVLFLDEPTSGVDPLTRREFWSHINAMVERGVTILVTTHFLDEAEYCDRIGLVYRGQVIAEGSPDDLKGRVRSDGREEPTLEDAFIELVEESDRAAGREPNVQTEASLRSLTRSAPHTRSRKSRLRRMAALVRKESLQIVRDPSSILIAGVLPLLLLFVYGFGVSLDLRKIAVGLVIEKPSPETDSFVESFTASRYFTVRVAHTRPAFEDELVSGRLKGVVVLAGDFSERLGRGDTAPIQVIVDGSDPNTAALVAGYVQLLWGNWVQQESISRTGLAGQPRGRPLVSAEPRVWFNPEINSYYALLPGAVAVILTLIGTLLPSLVVAREWERGTMEALLATPVTPLDLLVGKILPYYLLGLVALTVSVSLTVFGFGVPFRGSLLSLFCVSSAFLAVTLALGLLISTLAKNQFAAGQGALIVGFLPAFLLSGYIFEIDSMPAPLRLLTVVLPPRYYVYSLQTLFLAGDVRSVLVPSVAVLSLMAAVLFFVLARSTRNRLE
ncbi:MAG TPA: ATP-binding cassette domain-containing protein [Planctomycetaceae bacterium]|nr:ATP-binding cassette domain-containing protein [Planctomycetaceae bacterium]